MHIQESILRAARALNCCRFRSSSIEEYSLLVSVFIEYGFFACCLTSGISITLWRLVLVYTVWKIWCRFGIYLGSVYKRIFLEAELFVKVYLINPPSLVGTHSLLKTKGGRERTERVLTSRILVVSDVCFSNYLVHLSASFRLRCHRRHLRHTPFTF